MDDEQHGRLDSQVQSTCVALRDLAFRLGPSIKLPTVNDLCKSLKISRYTLMDALDILEQQNILYRRQGSGIYVSPKLHRKSVCVLFSSAFIAPKVLSPFWGILWSLIAKEMERRNNTASEYYSFHLMFQSDEVETDVISLPEEVMAMIRAQKIQGVLALGLCRATFEWLVEQGIPSVTFAGFGTHTVNLDNKEEARMAVDSLVAQGCQRVGRWDFSARLRPEDWRNDVTYQVFIQSLQDHGREFYPELRKSGDPMLYLSGQEQGYQLVMDVFGHAVGPKPDGIYISNDMVTSGALSAFRELGIQVGEDVKIVTHGNIGSPILFGEEKHLTILALDTVELVETMFASLGALMAYEPYDTSSIFLKPIMLNVPALEWVSSLQT